MSINNIYDITGLELNKEEIFENIFSGKNLKVERIISSGQITPSDFWYDQETDEWVLLLTGEAKIEFENGESEICLQKGDYSLIPAYRRHRVTYTQSNPPTVWLAIHFIKD